MSQATVDSTLHTLLLLPLEADRMCAAAGYEAILPRLVGYVHPWLISCRLVEEETYELHRLHVETAEEQITSGGRCGEHAAVDGSAIITRTGTTYTRFESWDDVVAHRASIAYEVPPEATPWEFEVVGTTLFGYAWHRPGLTLERWDLSTGEALEAVELAIDLELWSIEALEVTNDRVLLGVDALEGPFLLELDLATGEVLRQWATTWTSGLACGVTQ